MEAGAFGYIGAAAATIVPLRLGCTKDSG